MPVPHDTHRAFAASFDAGLRSGALPSGVTATDPAEAARRFAVYRNNVTVSLIDALGRRFPVIRRLVGEEFFTALARQFAEQYRPSSPVLIEWGERFPDFLTRFPPLAAHPYMADVASIEWIRGRAYHAADATPADPTLFKNAADDSLVLQLHPSVHVLRLSHPAVSIWAANQPGVQSAKVTAVGPEIALILRRPNFDVPVLRIGLGDAVLIECLARKLPLGDAAQSALRADRQHTPQEILARLMQLGAFTTPKEA